MVHFRRGYENSRIIDRLLWFAAAGIGTWMPAISIANAQEIHPRFPLTPAQVVGAMEKRSLLTSGVQIKLPASITAKTQDPQLQVDTIALISPHEARLRIGCSDRSACLSFFAIATYPDEISAASLQRKPDDQPAGVTRPASAVKTAAGQTPLTPQIPGKSIAAAGPPILRSGSPATLDFDGERVHVRLEVICLQGGVAGDKIRVTTRDRKQTYVAEIVAPTLLKGTLIK